MMISDPESWMGLRSEKAVAAELRRATGEGVSSPPSRVGMVIRRWLRAVRGL